MTQAGASPARTCTPVIPSRIRHAAVGKQALRRVVGSPPGDTRHGSGNETEAQLAACFGSGNETEAQLEGRAAACFGSGNETEAQLAARFKPGQQSQSGRDRLKQVKPRRWSGRVVHKECGQVLVIDKAPQMAKHGNFVTKRCPRCKKTVTVSTKELAMDLCDSDSE